MAVVFYNQNPTISDTILFDLVTTDTDGTAVDVYEVGKVTIYMIDRSRAPANAGLLPITVQSNDLTNTFFSAIPVAVFGDTTTPAWLATDPANSILVKEDFNESGDPQSGVYRLTWLPEFIREGDYVVCYEWTAIPAADTQLISLPFYILGDTAATTVIPTHYTAPGKYDMLMTRYLPKTYKTHISDSDLTPETVVPLNKAVAKGFTGLEDMANQIIDMFDANAVKDRTLPYLANLFNLKLRSTDSQLWRRQIKQAVPLFKQKGTYIGLKSALAAAGIELVSLTQLWQVKSNSLYTDAFFVTEDMVDPVQFTLTQLAILPVDPNNFEVSIKLFGTDEYQILSPDYVDLETVDGETIVTWVGDELSVDPIVLATGDVVKILYQIAPVLDQEIEDYIRTLQLFDLRPETEGLLPVKNWNVKVIEEDDELFPLICPVKHPFTEDVIWGKIRTEFAYSENAYNMEEYNGSLRDSTNPCDMDKSWQEPCSCCISSKFIINMEVSDLSGERMTEAAEIINEYKPFHAVAHQINFLSGVDDFVLSPNEEIEFLTVFAPTDTTIITQSGFNRLIPEGTQADSQEPNRSDLAVEQEIFNGAGSGTNDDVVFYSPGTSFRSMPLDTNGDNLLEILSGSDSGRYKVSPSGDYLIKLIQASPDSTSFPLDMSEVPFRLSNFLYNQPDASIYQDNSYNFSDVELDTLLYPIQAGWKIVVTSGLYAGTYTITELNTDNSISLSSFAASSSVSGLSYQLQTNTSIVVFAGSTGSVAVTNIGRLETDTVAEELGIKPGDFVEYLGTQYEVIERFSNYQMLILGYSGGDVVGSADVNILRRLASGVGFLDFQGMTLNGTVPVVDDSLEDNQFLENYAISINGNSYQIVSINGSDMSVNGPMLHWGLTGTAVNYSIVQYIKTSPYTVPTTGVEFGRLDRRGNDEVLITQDTDAPAPMWSMSNESVNNAEQVTITLQYR